MMTGIPARAAIPHTGHIGARESFYILTWEGWGIKSSRANRGGDKERANKNNDIATKRTAT